MLTPLLLLGTSNALAAVECSYLVTSGDDLARLDALDADTGRATTLIPALAADVTDVRGLVLDESSARYCHNRAVQTLYLQDGTLAEEQTGVSCLALGSGDGLVLVAAPGDSSAYYATPADVANAAARPTESPEFDIVGPAASDGAVLVSGGIAGRYLIVRELATGTPTTYFNPESIRGMIWGMSFAAGDLYLLDDGREEDGSSIGPSIRWFSLDREEELGAIALPLAAGEVARGLSCAEL